MAKRNIGKPLLANFQCLIIGSISELKLVSKKITQSGKIRSHFNNSLNTKLQFFRGGSIGGSGKPGNYPKIRYK